MRFASSRRTSPVDTVLSGLLCGLLVLGLLAFLVDPRAFFDAVGIVALGLFCFASIPAAR